MRLFVTFLTFILAGCGAPVDESPGSSGVTEHTKPEAVMDSDVLAKWQRSCALCHVAGQGGAPRMGDSEAWASRLSQGNDRLLQNTVEGLNRRPPLGYCMDCSEEDFMVMIHMMAGPGS